MWLLLLLLLLLTVVWLLFQLQSHERVNEVGTHANRVEFDAARAVGAAVTRATAWEPQSVHLSIK